MANQLNIFDDEVIEDEEAIDGVGYLTGGVENEIEAEDTTDGEGIDVNNHEQVFRAIYNKVCN